MNLSKDEQVIKSWNYSHTKGSENEQANLTVTNKRVISAVVGKKSFAVEEVPLKSIKSVYGAVNSPQARWWVILLGVVFFVAIVGIVILIQEFIRTKQCEFALVLSTTGGEGEPLAIYTNSVPYSNRKSAATLSSNVKVKVNKENATDILESIGAIIWDNQPNVRPKVQN